MRDRLYLCLKPDQPDDAFFLGSLSVTTCFTPCQVDLRRNKGDRRAAWREKMDKFKLFPDDLDEPTPVVAYVLGRKRTTSWIFNTFSLSARPWKPSSICATSPAGKTNTI